MFDLEPDEYQSVIVPEPAADRVYSAPVNDTSTAQLGSDFTKSPSFLGDLFESLSSNVGDFSIPWLTGSSGKDGKTAYESLQSIWGDVTGDTPATQEKAQSGNGQKFLETVAGGIGKAWDKDPMSFIKLGLGAVGGAYKDEEAKRAIALKRQQEMEDRAAFNTSVTGLRKPRQGIIQGALKRMDGSPVFDANGKQITKG